MNKIPVWNTIRFAYAFAFGHIGAIIGLIWLPTLLIAVLQFLPYALGTQSPPQDQNAATTASFVNLLCVAGSLILYAMNAVSVSRFALGLRQGGAGFHFSLGRSEWRVLGAYLACAFIMGALLLAYFSVFLFASSWVASAGAPLQIGLVVFGILGACALVYVGLRLVFLVVPVTVAEEKFDLPRGWSLANGNVWRILGVVIAVSVPLFLLQVGATVVIGGPKLLVPLPDGQQAMIAALNARMALLDARMPDLIGLSLILAPFNFGLTLGAAAAGYRALVPRRG